MFSVKEIVQLVENVLILLNLFEWRAVSIYRESLCLISSNIQSEVGKQGSATGCSADLYTIFRTFENIQKI